MAVPVRIESVVKTFGAVRALDRVSLQVEAGELFFLLGPSGCGKTTLLRSLAGFCIPDAGAVFIGGRDAWVEGIGEILTEGLKIQGIGTKQERVERARKALEQVELPQDALNRYAHEFSGGQRQRIGIARALTLAPEFIVADEPVSALDVSIQAQVVNLLRDLQQRLGLTMLFISHDLAVVEYICDRVIVVYLGRIMEIATSEELYARPQHPYTRALMSAIPSPDPDARTERQILKGDIPSPANPPSGCVFRTRCPKALDACAAAVPQLREVAPGHFKACIRDDLDVETRVAGELC